MILKFRNQPLDNRSMEKTDIKHSTKTCRFRLDIGPGTVGTTLEFNLIGPKRFKNRFLCQANVVTLVLSTEFGAA